jgi:hypothetical protein
MLFSIRFYLPRAWPFTKQRLFYGPNASTLKTLTRWTHYIGDIILDTLYACVEWASHSINRLGTVREITIVEYEIVEYEIVEYGIVEYEIGVKFLSTLWLKFVLQRVIYTINFHLWNFRWYKLKCQWPLQTDSQSVEQQTAYYQMNTCNE